MPCKQCSVLAGTGPVQLLLVFVSMRCETRCAIWHAISGMYLACTANCSKNNGTGRPVARVRAASCCMPGWHTSVLYHTDDELYKSSEAQVQISSSTVGCCAYLALFRPAAACAALMTINRCDCVSTPGQQQSSSSTGHAQVDREDAGRSSIKGLN
jgi:hypothetical protein